MVLTKMDLGNQKYSTYFVQSFAQHLTQELEQFQMIVVDKRCAWRK